MARKIEIYDTTLRDGSQGLGIHFSVADKVRVAQELERFGVAYIEGGWPGSNPRDIEFFAEARKLKFKHAKLAAFGSTRKKGVRASEDAQVRGLLEVETPVVTIYGKTSALHVREVLRCSPEENLAMIADTVAFLKSHGREVVYDCEHAIDGWKEDPAYAAACFRAAAEAGASRIVLCDTNGGSLPDEVAAATRHARAAVKAAIGIHTHDDSGLALANALASLDAGAVHVQGTMNGIGERTGNCDLTAAIPVAQIKRGWSCVPAASLKRLTALSASSTASRTRPPIPGARGSAPPRSPTRAARTSTPSASSPPPTSTSTPPRSATRATCWSATSPAAATSCSRPPSSASSSTRTRPSTRVALEELKKLEHQGWSFEDADASLALLLRRHLGKASVVPFEVVKYHISVQGGLKDASCEATVRVRIDGKESLTVAEGEGPVHALDQALREALVKAFPKLKKVHLADYKVRVLAGQDGTSAQTRVVVRSSDGVRSWGTVGVSANLVEASLRAIVDGYAHALA